MGCNISDYGVQCVQYGIGYNNTLCTHFFNNILKIIYFLYRHVTSLEKFII